MNDITETDENQNQETSSASKTCPNCACSARPNDKDSHSSLKILNEIHRMYEQRLDSIAREGKGDVLKLQNQTFRTWVNDLVEQNALLIRTVEELEIEATKRVALLEQRINEENKKYNEIEMELRSEITILQKKLRRKDSDLRGLIEVIRRLREQEYWNLDGLHFLEVTKSDIFGSPKRDELQRKSDHSVHEAFHQGVPKKTDSSCIE